MNANIYNSYIMMKKTRRSIIDVEAKKAPTHTRTVKSYHILPKGSVEGAKFPKGTRSPSNKAQEKPKRSPMRGKGMLSPKGCNTMPSPPVTRRLVKKLPKKQKSKPPVHQKSGKSPKSGKQKQLSNHPSKTMKAPPTAKKFSSPKNAVGKPARITKKKSSSVVSSNCPTKLKERLQILQDRVINTKALLRTADTERHKAATTIQRWYRKIKIKIEKSESWADLFEHKIAQSELVEQFRKALHERHLEIDRIFQKNEEKVKAQIFEFDNYSSHRSSERFVMVNTQKIPKLKLHDIHGEDSGSSSVYIDDDISDIEISSILDDDNSHEESQVACESYKHAQFQYGSPLSPINIITETEEPLPCKIEHDESTQDSLEEHIDLIIRSEMLNFFQVIQFVYKVLDVNPSVEFIEQCEDFLLQEIQKDPGEIMDTLTSPIFNDPFEKLLMLQNTGIGELTKLPSFELVLESGYLDKLQATFNPSKNSMRSLYIQMIYDSFNEALNHARPYGTQGSPYPWSSKSKLLLSDRSLEEIVQSTKKLMKSWAKVRSGPLLCEGSDHLNNMIVLDIHNNEKLWTEYEDEEAQVTFDVSDLVVEVLIEEILILLDSNYKYE